MLFAGCEKSSEMTETPVTQSKEFQSEYARMNKLMALVRLGKEQADGAVTNRSVESLPLEEVLWCLEAATNITYGSTSNTYSQIDRQQTTLTVSVTNGEVEAVDIYNLYLDALAQMNAHFDNISLTNKEYFLGDFKLLEEGNGAASIALSTSIIEPESPVDEGIDCDVFTTGWKVDEGLCLGGTYSGADDQLGKKVNQKYPILYPAPSGPTGSYKIGYTDVTIAYGDANQYFAGEAGGTPDEYFRVFKLYHNGTTLLEPNICIKPNNMNFYYCNLMEIVGDIIPGGYEFRNILVETQLDGNPDDFSTVGYEQYHRFELTYAKPIWRHKKYPEALAKLVDYSDLTGPG